MHDTEKKKHALTGTRKQRSFLDESLKHLPSKAQSAARFLACAVIRSTGASHNSYNVDKKGPASVSLLADTVRAHSSYRGSIAGAYGRRGIVDRIECVHVHKHHVAPDDEADNKTTEYKLDPTWYAECLSLGVGDNYTASRWRLDTEEPVRGKKHRTRGSKSRYAPDRQQEWVSTAEREIEVHDFDQVLSEVLSSAESGGLSSKECHRIHHILHCLVEIQRQTVSRDDDTGTRTVKIAYQVDKRHGRIYTRGAGIQSLPVALKLRMLPDHLNFDWASCHQKLLEALSARLAVEMPDEPDKDSLHIDRSVCKVVGHGIRYGGRLPHSMEQAHTLADKSGSIAAEIIDKLDEDVLIDLWQAYGPLSDAIGDLQAELDRRTSPGDTNAMGCKYEESVKTLPWALQGLEALMTSVLCTELDEQLILSDHDGVLVDKATPEELIKAAEAKAIKAAEDYLGVDVGATLKNKPVADKSDIQAYKKLMSTEKDTGVEDQAPAELHAQDPRQPAQEKQQPVEGDARALGVHIAKKDPVTERVAWTPHIDRELADIQRTANRQAELQGARIVDWLELYVVITRLCVEERQRLSIAEIRRHLSPGNIYHSRSITKAADGQWIKCWGIGTRRWGTDRSVYNDAVVRRRKRPTPKRRHAPKLYSLSSP